MHNNLQINMAQYLLDYRAAVPDVQWANIDATEYYGVR